MESDQKSEVFRLRLDRQTHRALKMLARQNERTMQSYLRVLVRREARNAGLLDAQPAQPQGVQYVSA